MTFSWPAADKASSLTWPTTVTQYVFEGPVSKREAGPGLTPVKRRTAH